eukprot:TRINITY_DN13400_c0_g1_i1.p1 TRINITY_DN13400_c0_g1~~TRINITY_DN13400_c0_g1_i1.p1  ORF type:complete len:772 (-),score=150.28 TRINITY_DN13400_c0_g1_i1:45-2360(-)
MSKEGLPFLNVSVVGECGSGKSCLGGILAVQTGAISERIKQNVKKTHEGWGGKHFDMTWLLDRTRIERERRITIDGNIVCIPTTKWRVSWFDTPGHPSFFHKVIGFVSQSDAAIFVCTPELESHLNYKSRNFNIASHLYMFQVRRIIVVINMIDLIKYDQQLFEKRKEQILKLLKVVGFKPEQIHGVIPMTALKKELPPWYQGNTLLEAIDTLPKSTRTTTGPPLIVINKFMRIKGVGVVIAGGILRGTLTAGDRLLIFPGNIEVVAHSIEIYHANVYSAKAGDQVGIRVSNITINQFGRGYRGFLVGRNLHHLHDPIITQNQTDRYTGKFALLSREVKVPKHLTDIYDVPESHKSFVADVLIVRDALGKNEIPFSMGSSVHIQSRLINCHAKVLSIIALLDKKTFLETKRTTTVKKGDLVRIQFFCHNPHFVSEHSKYPELSRIVISDSLSIIGAGLVRTVVNYRYPLSIATNTKTIAFSSYAGEILGNVKVQTKDNFSLNELQNVNLFICDTSISSGGLSGVVSFVQKGGTALIRITKPKPALALRELNIQVLEDPLHKPPNYPRSRTPKVKNIKFKTWNKKHKKAVVSVERKIERVFGMHLTNPDVLFNIFKQLDPISLCSCSLVNTIWYKVSSTNYLWELVFARFKMFPNYRLRIPEDSSQLLLDTGHYEKWRCAQIMIASRKRGGRLLHGPYGKADMRVGFPGLGPIGIECTNGTLQCIGPGLWHLPRFGNGRQGQLLITTYTKLDFPPIFWMNLLQDAVMTSYSP